MLKSEQKGRISALYKSRPARASNSPLERHSQIPARASNPPLERRMHAPRTFTDMMPAQAGLCCCLSARAGVLALERGNHPSSISSAVVYARAGDWTLEREYVSDARAGSLTLERASCL